MSKVAIVVGGAAVVVAVAITPFICGISVENEFNEEVEAAKSALRFNPDVKFSDNTYSRGWFSSTAKTVFNFAGTDVVINHNITHGPWGYFGRGKVNSQIEIPANAKSIVNELFAGKEPLTITTEVSFGGAKSLHLSSPAIAKRAFPNEPNVNLTWGGLVGSFVPSGDRLISNFKMPELTVAGEGKEFSLINLAFSGDGLYSTDWQSMGSQSWVSKTDFNIEKIAFADVALGESGSVSVNVAGLGTDESNGKGGFNVTFKLTDIKLPKMASAVLAGNSVDKVEFGFGVTGIPKQPLVDLLQKVDEVQKQNRMPSQFEMMPLAQNFGLAYLQGTPSVSANAMINSNKGKIAINAVAKLETPDTSTDIMSLAMGGMQRLVITVEPTISEAILDAIASHGNVPMTKEEIVNLLTDNNRFILNNGEYTAKFEFKNGQFFSNGKPDAQLQSFLNMLPLGRMF